MNDYLSFVTYLKEEKNSSENTITAYLRDIRAFDKYISAKGKSVESATRTDVVTYIMDLGTEGKSKSTTNRKLASLRAYYDFLIKKGFVSEDPTTDIKSPKAERKELEYLTIEEVETILAIPDDSIKGVRDRAILEVLYGTGIKVMELIEMNLSDVNMRMGFVTCSGKHGKPRIVPLGSYARAAMEAYLNEARPALARGAEEMGEPGSALFINYMGERFTRQGLWKVLRGYGKDAGMESRITPHIFRTSFAVHMIQNGADLRTLQELMGYDDMQALQAYLELSKSRIKDVYDKTHPRA